MEGALGSGIHPLLGITPDEYYRYRTRRAAYDYAIRERGWEHRYMLNIAAMQEVVDVPVERAPRILAAMHKLAGLMLFLFRNDPDPRQWGDFPTFSVRPIMWNLQVSSGKFSNDALKVCVPPTETCTWHAYLRLLWGSNPMFILGTKNDGLVFVPEHPDFATFMMHPPHGGWKAKRLDTGEEVRIDPSMEHVAQTDWTYMGFARLRLFWRLDTPLLELITAYRRGDEYLEAFLREHLEKVLLENRSSATPPPGDEMCSLAFIVGLIENFDAVEQFTMEQPYSFWLKIASDAESEYLKNAGIADLLSRALALSNAGLRLRGQNEEQYLDPLVRRVVTQESPAERFFSMHLRGRSEEMFKHLLYR